jgi:hypothetical protein
MALGIQRAHESQRYHEVSDSRERADAKLDEALEQTFPASDALGNTVSTGVTVRGTPPRADGQAVVNGMVVETPVTGSLKGVSFNRLACLLRHWTWADEAMGRFEREMATAWKYDEDPRADQLFGAYYHWCALLCGFGEQALEHGLLSRSQLDALRPDLEACLPELRACRQLLVVIPASREEHPRIVDLLRDDHTLDRLRRVHHAFGDALREEQISREFDVLDP